MAQASKTVSAGSRTIDVKPLPTEGKPADFTGAVGEYEFNVITSKSELNASESLQARVEVKGKGNLRLDRKSTRLNSSHVKISYAVFCLKKKRIQSFRSSCYLISPFPHKTSP